MKELLTCLRLVILSVLVCCVIYPAVLLAFGQLIVPWKANGSLLTDDQGQIIGSALVAQGFTRPEHFWPRPSAIDYNAGAAGGSNLSPASPKLTERARGIAEHYHLKAEQRLPADLVAASGSGLDPHITLTSAMIQVSRIARTRSLSDQQIEQLVRQNTDGKPLEWFGAEPIVNVLKLNVALDHLKKQE